MLRGAAKELKHTVIYRFLFSTVAERHSQISAAIKAVAKANA